jgi:hypothetical protein
MKKTFSYKEILSKLKWLSPSSKMVVKLLAGINRPIYPKQVNKLVYAVNKMGVLRPIIIAELDFITGKKEYYIIDGQHLYTALSIRLDMDVPYVVVQIKDKQELVETIALLNASSKSWSMEDYVTAWASLKTDYVKLNKYAEDFDLDISMAATILMNQSVDSSATTAKIKSGEFSIINEAVNAQIIKNLSDVLDIVPRNNRVQSKYFCREYVKFVRSCAKYDHKDFVGKLSTHVDKVVLATQQNDRLFDIFETFTKNLRRS